MEGEKQVPKEERKTCEEPIFKCETCEKMLSLILDMFAWQMKKHAAPSLPSDDGRSDLLPVVRRQTRQTDCQQLIGN